MSGILEPLNDEQCAAVTHQGGPLLILAGAGTGKTSTLTSRCAWLVEQGVPPERVLLLTFTRRAAREMVARARALLSSNAAGSIVGGTFHSVAYRLIAAHAGALELPPRFGVLDAGDAADLLDLLREEQGLADTKRRFPRKATLADIYSRCVNAQQPLSTVLAERFPWCEEHLEELARLFSAYERRKRKLGRLDLDDLLVYWHALVRDERIGGKLEALFEHVLVDEYQDLNALQVAIVRQLRREQRGLTVVGDDAQAIYGFRAASPEHILRFGEDFPDATVVTLERNYRSTQPILELTNEVWAAAPHAYPKRLLADREGGIAPQLVFCLDQAQQASQVCDSILSAREEGIDLREQAVLMRAGRHSNELELELTRRKIPFVKYGGISYLEAAHVKDFVCALRIADDPSDQLSWFRLLRLPPGVGPVSARRALDALDLTSLTKPAALCSRWREYVEPLLKPPARQACTPLINALTETEGERRVGLIAERIRDALRPLIKAHYPDWPARLSDLDTLTTAAGNAATLSGFLADIALDPPTSSADYAKPPHLDDDYLVLSTVHSAKGLEWETVHVINASDGDFPSDMALSDPEGLEEERRLFYVALTRARQSLTIYVPVRYYHRPAGRNDTHGYGKPSRFLTERAEALCERVDTQLARVNSPVASTNGSWGTGRVRVDLSA
ncbi:MAG: ATP-dependent helicase, partial [Gaiellaceae bacterium]